MSKNKPFENFRLDWTKSSLDQKNMLCDAAPDMLAALEVCLALLEGENLDEQFDGETEVVRAAIALATETDK